MEKLIETIDDVEKTCDFSCAYNSQTSSMNYHLNTTHKVYEKKKAVCMTTKNFYIFKENNINYKTVYIIGST
jgi:hypothetical protein